MTQTVRLHAFLRINYTPPDEALKVVAEVLSQPPEIVQELTKHIKFGD
jgi:hypothetical protein